LNSWKVKFLSQAEKEILLKAVIQAILTYSMSIFKVPHGLCKELNGLMQNFWWEHQTNTNKIHWMSWERMGFSKNQGGLGFRDLVIFNQTLLAKQCWRLLKDPNSMAARILQAKYYPIKSILEASVGRRPSIAWRSIMFAHSILQKGLAWRVGNG
jgi:hypothetical protein